MKFVHCILAYIKHMSKSFKPHPNNFAAEHIQELKTTQKSLNGLFLI